jgi:hypothetical protein
MAGISDSLEISLLNHLLGGGDYSPAGTHYFGLFTTAPTADDGTGFVEPAIGTNGYARKAMTNNGTTYANAANGLKTNGAIIAWAAATGAWGSSANLVAVGIFTASSGGSPIAWGTIDTPFAITTSGDTATLAIGALTFNFTGTFANAARNGLLDLAFGAATYTRSGSVYAAVFTAPPNYTGGGTEVSGGGYSRVAIANNSTNFPGASAGSKTTGTAIIFPTPSADWGSITDIGLFDSGSLGSGNLLYFKTLTTTRSVLAGQTFVIAAGALTVTLD